MKDILISKSSAIDLLLSKAKTLAESAEELNRQLIRTTAMKEAYENMAKDMGNWGDES